MDNSEEYHVPVLLKACVEGLEIKANGIYVDATFGGGGHSREILKYLDNGRLLAFDQDKDALKNAENIKDRSFTFCFANFRHLKKFMRLHKIPGVDGILGDLGISSHQIDTPDRGFSTRFNAGLDMRMDQNIGQTAEDVINEYTEADLHRIFGMFGEIKNARSLAVEIVKARQVSKIRTTEDLKSILQKKAPKGREYKYFAQVFQALRIEVNEEMKVLEEFLYQAVDILNPGGKLVIMSYHSLEDRMVKNLMKTGNISGKMVKDMYGNIIRPIDPDHSKPITAKENEIERNPRARSAKLRIGTKRNG